MNRYGLVRPGRLQNLSLLGGAQGDVMNGHWCDQAEIIESITARGRPRGCYECDQAEIMESITPQGCPRGCHGWALVRPGRDYEIYHCLGAPE